MTARSIERLFVRALWAICLVVIVRWFVVHKLDPSQRSQPLQLRHAPSADQELVLRGPAPSR